MELKHWLITAGALGAYASLGLMPAGAQQQLPGFVIDAPGQQGQGAGSAQQGANTDPSTAVDGYVAESSPTGSKTDTPLREIPQSISVVTRDQIEDRGAETVEEAISYSAGVAVSPFGLDNRYPQFIIRGFEQNTTGVYRDGLRLPLYSFTAFRTEMYGIDHVDVLRGPSTLYGPNNPGGMVNLVSKLPTGQEFGEVWASIGTHEAKAAGFDVGGVAENGKVSYRITGLVQDAETQVDFVEDDRVFIAPAVTFKPSSDTTFTILGSYQKDSTGDTLQLLPADKVRDGSIDRGTFYGEPDFSHFKGEQWGVGYQLEHKFDPAVTFRQNLRYDHATTDYQSIYPQDSGFNPFLPGFPAIPDTVLLAATDVDESASLFQVDNTVQIDSKYDRVDNKLLIGFDYSRLVGEARNGGGLVVSGPDIFQSTTNPTYGSYQFLPGTPEAFFGFLQGLVLPQPDVPLTKDEKQTQQVLGVYIQDQVKFDDRWVVTLGGRYDWAESELENKLAGTTTSSNDEAFTYRVGLNYLFDNGLTPYVSYSTSFLPIALTNSAGQPLQPEEGQQIEAGVKYQPKGTGSYVLASVFDATKQNVVQQDPATRTFVQTGEIQVRGFEVEGMADFDNGWKVIAAYSYWDAEITVDDVAANVGNHPERIPEHIAALWVDYTFRSGTFAGLGLGVGVRYFGDTFGDNANIHDVPSYTLLDAAIRYELDGWNFALTVSNLLDEDYVGTCGAVQAVPGLTPGYEYCTYGEGRTAMLRAGYRW